MTERNKNLVSIVVTLSVLIGAIGFAGNTLREHEAQLASAQEQRKEVVCPSFLSIARSSRDTLIVMRNEPLCNRYVLDNLK